MIGEIRPGGLLGTREDGLDQQLAVDGHRDRLAQLDLRVDRVVEREGEVLERRHRAGLVPVAEVVLGVHQVGGVDRRVDVKGTGQCVGVLRLGVLVDLEVDPTDLDLRAVPAIEPHGLDVLVVVPLALDLERPVADRGVLVLLGDVAVGAEGRLGHRVERRVAQFGVEVGERGVQRDREREVVDLREPGEFLGLRGLLGVRRVEVGVAGDLGVVRVDVRCVRTVRSPVPSVDEAFGDHLLAVVEGEALLQLDRPDLGVGRGDAAGDHGVWLAVFVVVEQAGKGREHHLAAGCLTGVRGNDVLRFPDADRDSARSTVRRVPG
jgi:hypothetical protein